MSGQRRLIQSINVVKGGSKTDLDKCIKNENEEAAKIKKIESQAIKTNRNK